jgi:rubrerythrin
VSVLGEVILIPEEGKTFVEAIVDFFQAHNHLERLLEWAIAKEINSTCIYSSLIVSTIPSFD